MSTDSYFADEIVALSSLADGRLVSLYEYWVGLARSGHLPSRASIQPEAIRFALGWVNLIDVEREPLRFRFRLVGTEVARATGTDATGLYTSAMLPPVFGCMLDRHFGQAVAARAPIAHRILLVHDYRTYPYERLTLPLAADGRDIDMLMTASSLRPELREGWERVHGAAAAE